MNSPNPHDLEERLRQLEADLNSTPGSVSPSPTHQSIVQKTLAWFQGLPQGGQVIVVCMAGLAVLSVLSAVFQLLFLAIRLAVLAGVCYVVYKIFFATASSAPPK